MLLQILECASEKKSEIAVNIWRRDGQKFGFGGMFF